MIAALKRSLRASAGTIVFGMEDGAVASFGLVFGVAAATTDSRIVLIAGASGAAAASVSMMAGVYLQAGTDRDAGLAGASSSGPAPLERALWMLLSDLTAAVVPILPFVVLPLAPARAVCAGVTLVLLVLLGVGRALIGRTGMARTVAATVAVGAAAGAAGVLLGMAVA